MPAVPAFLRTLRALRILNIAAVGLSLGAIVSGPINLVFGEARDIVWVPGLSTLLAGTLWAWLLRLPKARVGCLVVPIAVANAAVSLGLMMALDGHAHGVKALKDLFVGMALGATLGALAWIPGLLLTLLFFGLPLWRARKLAERGLDGEERGEKLVGAVCAVMGGLGLACAVLAGERTWLVAVALGVPGSPAGVRSWIAVALGARGTAARSLAAGLAWARGRRRHAFVARAEAGAEPGFRVDATSEGKVLMRVTSHGEAYRAIDFEERIADLGEGDEVTRVEGESA